MRGGGGGFGRRSTTGGGGDGGVGESFTPGQDGNLSWNTTQPIAERPILLYVFDGHVFEGPRFDYSRSLEVAMLKDPEVIKLAREFTCEKICLSDHEFLRKVKGREPVTGFLAGNLEKSEQRKVKLHFLDSSGKLIATFDDPKALKQGAPALLQAMKKAREENAKRIAAATTPAKGT